MAGTKRSKNAKDKGGKRAKTEKMVTDVHSVTPHKSKQSKRENNHSPTKQKERKSVSDDRELNSRRKTTVAFYENDQYIEMEAEGQDEEFLSETESQGKSDAEASDDVNNNAVVSSDETGLEDGECSQDTDEDDEIVFTHQEASKEMGEKDKPGWEAGTKSMIERSVTQSMNKMQSYFEQKFEDMSKFAELEKQLAENKRKLDLLKAKGKFSRTLKNPLDGEETLSEITIYNNAIEKQQRQSTSSEEGVNTSDEFMFEDSIVEEELRRKGPNDDRDNQQTKEKRSLVSVVIDKGKQVKELAVERAEEIIQEAESARAGIYEIPGKQCELEINNKLNELRMNVKSLASAQLDEDYLLVASHVDPIIRQKIINHEYVDFAKLLRKDKQLEDEQKMTMINKGGMMYWVPLERNTSINGYGKWDQAFRVFLDIYSGKYLERTSELIQYNHIIHTAAGTYAWENVARYDQEFRCHMERHPTRSWGVILQQAWTMFLKDRVVTHNHTPQGKNNSGSVSHGEGKNVNRKLCFGFNRGFCKFGTKCRFEHRCGYCNKFGHGTYNCRTAQAITLAQQTREAKVEGKKIEQDETK